MVPTLEIQLLDSFRLIHNQSPLETINTPRQQSLLAYLLLHCQVPQLRQFVAFTFWPDTYESRARSNLRKALHRLRQDLPNVDRFLAVSNTQVQWLSNAPFSLDVNRFESALAQVAQVTHPAEKRHYLEHALALYQGDLLPGCYDDWIIPDRERLRNAFLYARRQTIELLEEMREYQAAIAQAQALLQDDPLEEAVSRLLMRLYLLNNDQAGALRVYKECAASLKRDLGVEPAPATHQLYKQIQEKESIRVLSRPQTRPQGTTLPLVGRHQEWMLLQQAWQKAQSGSPQFVCISGESGIGKTRLAEELLTWATQLNIKAAMAHCYAGAGGLAYEPVTTWLRSTAINVNLSMLDNVWFSEVVRLLPERMTDRPHLSAPSPIDETWQRQRLFEALARAVSSSQAPLILILDDIQWSDRETLTWLSYLLRYEIETPLLIVTTLRVFEIAADDKINDFLRQLNRLGQLTTIALEPLNADEIGDLAQNLYGRGVSKSLVERLYQETEGNPLFMVESVLAALAHPDVPFSDVATMTPKVQAVIEIRLAQLFYKALIYYQRSADYTADLYAYHEAEQFYAQAIRMAVRLNQSGEQLIHLYQQQGRMLEHAGEYVQAVGVYRELEAMGRKRWDKVMECVAITHLVDCLMKPDDVHDLIAADPLISRGLKLAQENGLVEQEAHLLWSQMMRATHYGRTAEAQAAAEAAINIAREHGLERRLAFILHDLAINLRLNGLPEKGNECAAEARSLFRRLSNAPLLADNLNQDALFKYLQLAFDSALDFTREAYEIGRDIGNGWNMAYATWIQAMIWDMRGEWGQAQSAYLEAQEFGRDVGFLMSLTIVPIQLGLLWQRLGQFEQAKTIHEEALVASTESAPFMLRAAEGALALDAFARGNATQGYHWQVRAYNREPLGDIGTSLALTIPVTAAVTTAHHNQDWQAALIAVTDGLSEARRRKLKLHEVYLGYEYGRCLAGLKRMDEAEMHFCDTLAKAEQFALLPLALSCAAGLYRLHNHSNHQQKATEYRQMARDLIDRLAATLPESTQRRRFLNTTTIQSIQSG